MIKKVLFVFGSAVWLLVAFFVVFRMTFPSDAIVARAALGVDEASGGTMQLDIERVSPAWVGLRGRNVVLSSVADGVASPMLAVEQMKAKASLFSLISGSPAVQGWARFGDGRLDFDTRIAAMDAGGYGLTDLQVETTGFELAALPPIQGTKLVGTGTLDLLANVDAGEGLQKAEGRARLNGRGLVIESLAGGFGPIAEGFGIVPATLDEIDIEFNIVAGRALVERAIIDTSLAAVDLSGDILLQDDFSSSRLRLDIIIDARDGLAGVSSAMNSAEWSDGKYHYELRGTVGRPRFTAARERSRRATRPEPVQSAPAADDEEERPSRAERARTTTPRLQGGGPGRGGPGREATLERARAAREALTAGRQPDIRSPATRLQDGPRIQGRDEDADTTERGGDTAEPSE